MTLGNMLFLLEHLRTARRRLRLIFSKKSQPQTCPLTSLCQSHAIESQKRAVGSWVFVSSEIGHLKSESAITSMMNLPAISFGQNSEISTGTWPMQKTLPL